jgi:hypothetical protein
MAASEMRQGSVSTARPSTLRKVDRRYCTAGSFGSRQLVHNLPHSERGYSLFKGAGKRLRFLQDVDRRVRLCIPIFNLAAAPDLTRHVTVSVRHS